ncbi:MAG: DivIVA domain-containing protein, partial [Oscillospiraceae bacterium]
MLTPQEVSGRAFSKAMMGGYNMAMVDEFLDELTDDYTSLYKENAALKAKLKVLVEKVEEYRSTEDSMRATLLTAQKMAGTIVQEAEKQRDTLMQEAEGQIRQKIVSMQSDTTIQQQRLAAGRQELAGFIQSTRALCRQQLAFLEQLPGLTVEAQTPP